MNEQSPQSTLMFHSLIMHVFNKIQCKTMNFNAIQSIRQECLQGIPFSLYAAFVQICQRQIELRANSDRYCYVCSKRLSMQIWEYEHCQIDRLYIKNLMQFIIGSSTPDGMAPLPKLGVMIFVFIISLLSLSWGLLNFYILLKKQPLNEEESNGVFGTKMVAVVQMGQKILLGTLSFLKFNYIVCLVAAIVFFMVILGSIEHFDTFQLSLAYLAGFVSSIIIGSLVSVASSFSYSRICATANNSVLSSYLTARNLANFVSYFATSFTVLIMFLLMIIFQKEESQMQDNDIQMIGKALLSFSFGISTVAIGSKITGVIYSKGAEGALSLVHSIEPRLKRDGSHPIIINKAIGCNLNKSIANALDYSMYLSCAIAVSVSASVNNIFGVDQMGEIVFDISINNAYLPFLVVAYVLFFSTSMSVVSGYVFHPSTCDQITLIFKREIIAIIVFLLGFLSLAAYLCLPAEFQSKQLGDDLLHPYLAYLLLIIPMVGAFLLMFAAEIIFTHPWFVYILINSSQAGEATNILSGLSFGYFTNVAPILFMTGIGFLGFYWLGTFGIAVIAVGIACLLPNYLAINSFCASTENASMIGFINQLPEEVIGNLMQLSDTKRSLQPQIHMHLILLALSNCYCLYLLFVPNSNLQANLSLTSPAIQVGLLLGGMLAYTFSSRLISSISNVSPVLCYDLKAQIQETPGIALGHVEVDAARSNKIYSINTILQMKFLLPYLLGPFIIFGIGLGPLIMLGTMVGALIAGIQLSISSGSSGFIWNSARTEVFLGRARDGNDNQVRADSQQGIATDVGNEIGNRLKDAVGLGLHGYITYLSLLSTVMANLYVNIRN